MVKSTKKNNTKKEKETKKAERPIATWWWVRKNNSVPEIALYGDFDEGKGFKLMLEDSKLYQESDFIAVYGQAINPAVFEIYDKIKNRNYSSNLLTEDEMLIMRLYQCKRCVVEGCGPGHSWQCFKENMKKRGRKSIS